MTFTVGAAEEAAAQVEWKDRYVTLGAEDQTKPSVARPSRDDYTVVVWEDERDGRKRIYIQKVDNVTGLAQWAPDGIEVCPMPEGEQTNPRAAYDSVDGVYVTWEDTRFDPDGGRKTIYIQRVIFSTGEIDPSWPLDGQYLSDPDYNAERPRISGSWNSAFVVWMDWRNDDGSNTNRDVYVHQVKFDSQFPDIYWNWPVNRYGLNVASSSDPDQINPEIARDYVWRWTINNEHLTGVVIVYEENSVICQRTGLPSYNVFAGSVTAEGWWQYRDVRVADTQGSQQDGEEQINPRIVTAEPSPLPTYDVATAVVTWEDARRNPTPAMYEIWAQRLDGNGNTYWTTNGPGSDGIPVSNNLEGENHHVTDLWFRKIPPYIYEPHVLVAWELASPSNGRDVYAALLNVYTASVVSPNGTAGEPICTSPYDQTQIALDHVPDPQVASQQMLIAWRNQAVVHSNIAYQNVTIPGWTLNRPADGWLVTEAKDYQEMPEVSRDVFVYQDARRNPLAAGDAQDDFNIYCQKAGYCVSAKEMEWCEMFAQWTAGTDAANMRQVVDPLDQSIFVVWDEERNGERAVFIQKFDKDGVPRWTNNGVRVSDVGWTAQYPDVVTDHAGGAQVVWQQNETSQPEQVWYANVTYDGAIVNPYWVASNGFPLRQLQPVCVEHFEHPGFSPGGPGLIFAFLYDNLNSVSRVVGTAEIAFPATPTAQAVSTIGITSHEDIKIIRDNVGGCYLMSHGQDPNLGGTNGLINVSYCMEVTLPPFGSFICNAPEQDETTAYTSFGGYDMVMDVFPSTPGPAYHATVAYSINSAPASCMDVFVQRYAFDGTNIVFTAPLNVSILLTASHTATTPSITFDNEYLNPYGGVIVAWDHQDPVQPGVYRHDVETNQVVWFGAWPPFGWMPLPPISVASGYVEPTWPDISHVRNIQPWDEPQGYVVWQGMTEVCSPSRPLEIMGDLVDYQGCPPYSRGPQWTTGAPNYRRVDPGAGLYSQFHPIVQKSGEDGVVFWYDTRTGSTNIAGTTMFDQPGDIDWRKRRDAEAEPAADIVLGQNYPNPVSLSGVANVAIAVTLSAEQTVSLAMYDLLGRRIATVFEGVLRAGSHSIPIGDGAIRQLLSPGMYVYSLQTRDGIRSRRMLITR